jgi:transcriptional regulator with XRE-family HTH domain
MFWSRSSGFSGLSGRNGLIFFIVLFAFLRVAVHAGGPVCIDISYGLAACKVGWYKCVCNREQGGRGTRPPCSRFLEWKGRPQMSLGARLKELRIKHNQSLQDVADAVNASKAHIWEIERGGSKNPTMGLLNSLADHFAVSVAYLVGETPDENTEPELVAMFRGLKKMSELDRKTIRALMEHLQKAKKDQT